MRLIDADAADIDRIHCYHGGCCYIEDVQEWLDDQPTIEAEPMVHCKECRHWGTGYCAETDAVKVCEYAKYMVGGNGYCVYGERRYNGKAESQDR